jgi:hypothetical protein
MYTDNSYSCVCNAYRSVTGAYVIEGVATPAFTTTLLLYRYVARSTFPDVLMSAIIHVSFKEPFHLSSKTCSQSRNLQGAGHI